MPFQESRLDGDARTDRGTAFFQSLIEGSRDAVIVADAHGVITYQSPAVGPELGYESGECTGRQVLDFVHPSDHSLVYRTLASALATPAASHAMELRLRSRRGQWLWVEVRATNLLAIEAVRGVVLHTLVIHQRKLLELCTVAAKVDPHFLYNVLNSISAMIREGKGDEAVEAIGSLRELMGSRIQGADDRLIRLAEEWSWVRSYLVLEQLRFGDTIQVEIDPLPAGLRDVAIPYRVIQPLAENAVKHGLRTRPGGGVIRISAAGMGDVACITVFETGGRRGRNAEDTGDVGLGVGLETVRQRLQLHYGDAAGVELSVQRTSSTAALHLPIDPAALRP